MFFYNLEDLEEHVLRQQAIPQVYKKKSNHI